MNKDKRKKQSFYKMKSWDQLKTNKKFKKKWMVSFFYKKRFSKLYKNNNLK